jgi:hypothetical protein
VVTTTADTLDQADGLISLREATKLASVTGHEDTIVLATGVTYRLTLCDVDFGVGPRNGALHVRDATSVRFEGHGSTVQQTCRDGIGLSSLGTPVVLHELTITDAQIGFTSYFGGPSVTPMLRLDHSAITNIVGSCIDPNGGALTIVFSRIDGCGSYGIEGDPLSGFFDIQDSEIAHVAGGSGTGYAIVGDSAALVRTAIHHNGTGVYLSGAVTMVGSHFDHNGGVIAGLVARDSLVATDSTFDDNVADGVPSFSSPWTAAGVLTGGEVELTRVSASRNRASHAGVVMASNAGGPVATITDSRVDDNHAEGGGAGTELVAGIVNAQGSSTPGIRITRTTANGNTGADAAGIAVWSTIITDSTVRDNVVVAGGTKQGPAAVAATDMLTMSGSTVANNTVRPGADSPSAGGVRAIRLDMSNSTIVGNTGDVGGALVTGFGAIVHVTMADNTGSVARHLGLVPQDGNSGINLSGSVLSSPPGVASPSCGGTSSLHIFSKGYNFVSDATCPLFPPGGAIGDLTDGGDALLAPLAANGGFTETRVPVPLSPLRNTVPVNGSGLCSGVDQRGVARPQGVACDVGAVEAQGSRFHAVAPTRLLDSRLKPAGFSGPVVAGVPRSLVVAGGGVPETAAAVVVNVTVTGSSVNSFLTVWPEGVGMPNASAVNFAAGQTIPNLVTVKVGAAGKVAFATNQGQTDVVVDLLGWFDDGTGAGDGWTGIDPVRLLDSRTATGGWGATLVAGAPRELTVRGVGNVPAEATAVVANVTATAADANSFLTVWPAGGAKPTSSNVNFAAGETIANGVIVPVGAGGKISIANAVGKTHVVVDVTGYFIPGGGSRFFAVTPTRVLDDRSGVGATGPWQPGQVRAVTVTGGAIAANATGVAVNMTVTNGTVGSFLSVYPHGAAKPSATTINFGPGQTIANQTMVRVVSGQVDIYNQLGKVDVIADVVGAYG